MKSLLLSLALIGSLCTCVRAQSLDAFRWKSRPLIFFTPSADDPLFQEQYQAFADMEEAFSERNIKILFITPEGNRENTGLFLDESQSEWYYNHFDPQPYQFELVLVGLDGHEKFRGRNTVTPPSVILGMIDRMPMRRREILQGTGTKSMLDRDNDGKPAAQRY